MTMRKAKGGVNFAIERSQLVSSEMGIVRFRRKMRGFLTMVYIARLKPAM